jgi:hypothetical protein
MPPAPALYGSAVLFISSKGLLMLSSSKKRVADGRQIWCALCAWAKCSLTRKARRIQFPLLIIRRDWRETRSLRQRVSTLQYSGMRRRVVRQTRTTFLRNLHLQGWRRREHIPMKGRCVCVCVCVCIYIYIYKGHRLNFFFQFTQSLRPHYGPGLAQHLTEMDTKRSF